MIVGLLAVAVVGTACGSPTEPSVNDQPAVAPTENPATTEPPTTPPPQTVAKVGDALTLNGSADGETMAVTVVKVVDPAQGADQYTKPKQGERYVAVQFRLQNTGTAVYDDSPSNGAKLIDSDGQNFNPTYAEVAAGPSMSGSVVVKPGATALGFIVFGVPAASKIAKVQFALNSGFAEQTGEWVTA